MSLRYIEIHAVSDANHYSVEWLTAASEVSEGGIKFSYDEVWRERGGVDNGKGFFSLPVAPIRRAEDDIPSKKKQMYRKRYAKLDQVEIEILIALRSGIANPACLTSGMELPSANPGRRG